jgi:hypothetical protein
MDALATDDARAALRAVMADATAAGAGFAACKAARDAVDAVDDARDALLTWGALQLAHADAHAAYAHTRSVLRGDARGSTPAAGSNAHVVWFTAHNMLHAATRALASYAA